MEWVLLDENAIEPRRATKDSAGYDVFANETVTLQPHETKVIKTGIGFKDLNPDHCLQISLRSGFSINRPFIVPNGYGLIDADYTGEIGIVVWNRHWRLPATIDKGERVAQIIELKYFKAKNEIVPTLERKGGYGSTDN